MDQYLRENKLKKGDLDGITTRDYADLVENILFDFRGQTFYNKNVVDDLGLATSFGEQNHNSGEHVYFSDLNLGDDINDLVKARDYVFGEDNTMSFTLSPVLRERGGTHLEFALSVNYWNLKRFGPSASFRDYVTINTLSPYAKNMIHPDPEYIERLEQANLDLDLGRFPVKDYDANFAGYIDKQNAINLLNRAIKGGYKIKAPSNDWGFVDLLPTLGARQKSAMTRTYK